MATKSHFTPLSFQSTALSTPHHLLLLLPTPHRNILLVMLSACLLLWAACLILDCGFVGFEFAFLFGEGYLLVGFLTTLANMPIKDFEINIMPLIT